MKKRLDTSVINSELSGNSAFFPNYKNSGSPTPSERSEKAASPDRPTTAEPVNSTPAPQLVPERPNVPTPVRPNGRRIITRNSFEIYEDQMETLRKLSYQDKVEGLSGSMSGMVREAIDEYLQKRSSGKITRTPERYPVHPFARTLRRSLQRPNYRTSDGTAHRTGLCKPLYVCLYWQYIGNYIEGYRTG